LEKKKRLPFQDMTREIWINLAIALVITFYVLQIGEFIFNHHICKNNIIDYCLYWSSGNLSKIYGFKELYNIEIVRKIQLEIFSIDPILSNNFPGYPLGYLPIFILPFTAFSIFNLPLSYFLWTLINFIVLILYLRFFTKKLFGYPLPNKLLLFFMLSLPIFINFFEGQVNIFLLICVGEFFRALLSEKPFIAGLWLGGWLLKFVLLILIIPFLLIKGKKNTLLGFFTSSFIILLASISLVGIEGMLALKNLLLDSASGIPINNVWAMINWRMIGWQVSTLSSSTFGWVITIIGTSITICLTFIFFRKWDKGDPIKTAIMLLGIFSATCVVSWHSHLHTSIILIPLLAYLMMKNIFNKNLFIAWIFIPVMVLLIGMIIAVFLQLGNLSHLSIQLLSLARGLPGLIFCLLILNWSVNHIDYEEHEINNP